MSTEHNNIKTNISNFSTMEIKNSQENTNHLEKDLKDSNDLQIIDFAQNKIEYRDEERKKQIELLTKSLTSSSRIVRWISSFKTVLKQFL